MKPSLFLFGKDRHGRGGFSLVEATFSIGLFSFGFLTLLPLLSLGMNTARQARDNRSTAQIAQTLIEEAKQGTLTTGTAYLDFEGNSTTSGLAIYTAQTTSQSLATSTGNTSAIGTPTQLTIKITPVGAPNNARTYAVVFSAPQ